MKFLCSILWVGGVHGHQHRCQMIKFVTSSKENEEQFKSNLMNFYLFENICLVANMVQDELRGKTQEIIHNNLIMQQEDY